MRIPTDRWSSSTTLSTGLKSGRLTALSTSKIMDTRILRRCYFPPNHCSRHRSASAARRAARHRAPGRSPRLRCSAPSPPPAPRCRSGPRRRPRRSPESPTALAERDSSPATFTPCSKPSRSTSVNRMAATPTSSKRSASSAGVSSAVSAQPWVAMRPPLASAPTTIRPGKARAASFTRAGIGHGHRAQDDPRDAGLEPGGDGLHVADAAAELDRQIDGGADGLHRRRIHRRPSKAPLRSTQCSHLKPASANSLAWAAGSSLKTVADSITPALQPHATAVLQIDGGEQDHGVHSRKLPRMVRPAAWLFSGWNCVPDDIAASDRRGERAAVIGGGQNMRRIGGADDIGMHEIGVRARLQAFEQRMRREDVQLIPAHMRESSARDRRGSSSPPRQGSSPGPS